MIARNLEILIRTGQATQEELAGLATSDDAAELLAMRMEGVHSRDALFEAPAPKAVGGSGKRVLRFYTSSEHQDRMGDVIKQDGWDFGNYNRNPVMLLGHDSGGFVIGREVNRGFDKGEDGVQRMFQDFEFMEERDYAVSHVAYMQASKGFMKATSVGFTPKATTVPGDEEERIEMGLGPYGLRFDKSELLETSLVAIPANPHAVSEGLKSLVCSGRVGAHAAEQFAKANQEAQENHLRAIKSSLDSALSALDEQARELSTLRRELESQRRDDETSASLLSSLRAGVAQFDGTQPTGENQ